MRLALIVLFVVLGVTVLMGIAGYLIDRSAARDERSSGGR
jgi:hypothetical protein